MIETRQIVTVWFDVADVEKIEKIKGFVPVYIYHGIAPTNPYEWGRVEQDDLVVIYRATEFINYIKKIFIG